MKSAYIITMHCPLNYGAILQTYALQTFLESKGIKTGVIDYCPFYIVYDQELMYVGSEQYKKNMLTRWVYRILKAPTKYRRRLNFHRFAKMELHLTDRYVSYEDIQKAGLVADFFFCGSDQIWNVGSNSHKDPSYFLKFAPESSKKVSYAASGNLPIIDEVKNVTCPMINGLDFISMREDSTIKNIQSFITKQIAHVCDPVFLLDSDNWRSLYSKYSSFNRKEKYVLVYPMGNGGENTIEKARQIANQKKLPLYMISASKKIDNRIDRRYDVDPYTFLSLTDNAEVVVTNSFHGTSFCIILKKQFWTCVAEGSNQRITSLLHKAGLLDRLLKDETQPNFNDKLDLDNANDNLKPFIDLSKTYINNIIDE